MKRIHSVIALVLAMVMMMAMFAGCQPAADDGDKVTVCWYNGSTLLKEESVEKGSKLTSWTPEVDGKEFTGWYAEASLAGAFDFDKEITEDTDIFAAFKSNEFVADETAYYLIGSGAGSLSSSNWDHDASAANLSMEKQDDATANIYKITIEMYAGDRFQICHDGSWDGQQGIGYMPGAAYADGINPIDQAEVTAADKKYAEVKNADGEVVFIGGDEYGKESYVWNIILNEGHDGKYEITLTTYPANPQYNTIEATLIEKLDAQEETHKMHLVGTFNGWSADDETEAYNMTKSEDGKTWTGMLEVKAEDTWADGDETKQGVAFKVVNQVNSEWIGIDGENICLDEAGWYGIQYTAETNAIEIQKMDYYVVGTFVGADGSLANFAIKEGTTPKLTNGTATFTAIDVTDKGDYSWLKDQGKPGVMAIKVVFGCELVIKTWYSDEANDGDNFYINAGEVTVTLDTETGTVTVA